MYRLNRVRDMFRQYYTRLYRALTILFNCPFINTVHQRLDTNSMFEIGIMKFAIENLFKMQEILFQTLSKYTCMTNSHQINEYQMMLA